LLNYNASDFKIKTFFVIPKHFFTPDIIEKRKPLSQTARRAGWVGCNILFNNIPQSGKIYIIKNGSIEPKNAVLKNWQRTLFLKEERKIETRGWLLDVMNCIDIINKQKFNLNEIYLFEKTLSKKHPNNKHIKDKIRQQLQILRDRGYIKFIEKGVYQKI
jgi:type II restriction enzyme